MARIDAALAQAFDHMRRNLGIGFGARGRCRERGATGAGEPTHMLRCDQALRRTMQADECHGFYWLHDFLLLKNLSLARSGAASRA
jgi:hypothetical protein